MFKSLLYKELLKTRWFLLGYLVLGLIVVGAIFLKVQHDFKFYDSKNYWYNVLFMNYTFYSSLKFVPLVGGIIIGISQYFPETIDKRIKLAFHLPIKENNLLLSMMSFGTMALTVVYLCIFSTFIMLSSHFFPAEIVTSTIVSITPWFLAGYTAYFLIGMVVMEPIWRFRIVYTIIGALFVTQYLKPAMAGAFAPINPCFMVMTASLSISLLFSAYRFRKGEQ